MKPVLLGAALVFLGTPGVAAPADQIEEAITSAEIKEVCPFDIREPSPEENARIKAKLDAMGKAVAYKIWNELDEQDPSQHEQNAMKAEMLFRKKIEGIMGKGRALVAEKGCAALIPHAREVLEAIRDNP